LADIRYTLESLGASQPLIDLFNAEVPAAIPTNASVDVGGFITTFLTGIRAQGGGHTKHFTRRHSYSKLKTHVRGKHSPRKHSRKHSPRKHSRKHHVKSHSPSSGNRYKDIYETLLALDAKSIPYGLSVKQYANELIERIIILETINEVMFKKDLAKPVELVSTSVTNDPVVGESLIHSEAGTPELLSDPTRVEVQAGGAPISNEMLPILSNLFWNTIDPFVRNYFEADYVISELKESAVAGDYIEDVIGLLLEIIALPDIDEGANHREYRNMKVNAKNTLTEGENCILKKLQGSSNEGNYLDIVEPWGAEVGSFKEVKDNILGYRPTITTIDDTIFEKINKLTIMLSKSFKLKKFGDPDNLRDPILKGPLDAKFEAGGDITIDDYTQYLRFAAQDYLNGANPDGGAGGAGGGQVGEQGGGYRNSRTNRFKRRNGSPRRRSLSRR